MTNEDYKIFIRYLKARGLYHSFWKDARKFPERRYEKPMKEYMLSVMCSSCSAIMNMITWRLASFKHWEIEYRYYASFYLELEKNKEHKDELFEGIKKVLE